MKKKLVYLVMVTFLLGGSTQAFWGDKDPKGMTKEERKAFKQAQKEAQHQKEEGLKREKELEKERRKAEREAEKRQKDIEKKNREAEKKAKKQQEKAQQEAKKRQEEASSAQRKAEKERRKAEKKIEQERKAQERRLEKEKKKNLLAFNRTQEGKQLKKEELKVKKIQDERRRALEAEQKYLEKEERKMRRKEEAIVKKEERKEEWKRRKEAYHAKLDGKYERVRDDRKTRDKLIEKWASLHSQQVRDDYTNGKYATLYAAPAWPTHAQYYENDHYLNIQADYNYATDAYDSSGASSNSDVTRLAFGEEKITFKDISLVSKLLGQDKLVASDASATSLATILKNHGDREIKFNGQVESYGITLDLSRYIFRNNIAAGIEIPLIYKKHHLRFDIPFGSGITEEADDIDNRMHLIFRKLLDAKCFDVNCRNMKTIGNSATGIGDIAAFVSGHLDSTYFEKIVFGVRVQFPTAKEAKQTKLWSPELGNGGSTDFTGYLGAHVACKKYLNPHILVQGTFSTDAHVERRVPKRFTLDTNTATNIVKDFSRNQECPFEKLAFADRVRFAQENGAQATGNNAELFDEFDTCIKGFADNVARVEFTRGPEFKLRLGNIFERFISHRGFMDMFYDLRVKARDEYRSLCDDDWNISLLRVHTQEIEHRFGFDFSYQFDWDTRLRCGMRYTFAGMNVPKTFTLTASVNHTF